MAGGGGSEDAMRCGERIGQIVSGGEEAEGRGIEAKRQYQYGDRRGLVTVDDPPAHWVCSVRRCI